MELEEFVTQTLLAIRGAISRTNESLLGQSRFSMGTTKETDAVEFDVAITEERRSKGGLTGKVAVWGQGITGGGERGSSDSTVSRIKFSVLTGMIKDNPEGKRE